MAVPKFLLMASLNLVLIFLPLLGIASSAGDNNGGGYSGLLTPKLDKEERLLSAMIGIQGIILYKFGSTIAPLQGKVLNNMVLIYIKFSISSFVIWTLNLNM